MIRSVPANASDALYCMLLAQNAVHGAMAGDTLSRPLSTPLSTPLSRPLSGPYLRRARGHGR
jgi:hypothetical protein